MAETGTPLHVTLLTEGDPGQLTGGYLYQQRMAAAAQAQKCALNFVSLRRRSLTPAILEAGRLLRDLPRSDALVIDSIVAAALAPWMRQLARHLPTITLVHQQPGGVGHNPISALRRR